MLSKALLPLFFETLTGGLLENFAKFTGKQICRSFDKVGVRLPQGFNLIKKETPAKVFSCELCEFFKNGFFYRTPTVAASSSMRQDLISKFIII